MEFMEVVRRRRSIRAYKSREVEERILKEILEAARWAPSAKNLQMWKLVVVRDPDKKKALAKASFDQNFIAEAPLVIAAVALDPGHVMSCGVPAYAVDLAIAVEHMVLAACDKGLGSCWIGAFEQEKVREILGIPSCCKVVALLPIGYPAESPEPPPRKPLSEIVSYDAF